jgi:hypothetical protein
MIRSLSNIKQNAIKIFVKSYFLKFLSNKKYSKDSVYLFFCIKKGMYVEKKEFDKLKQQKKKRTIERF